MADVAVPLNSPASAPVSSAKTNIAIIEGVIDSIRDFNGIYEVRVILPAADRYSKPGAALIKTARRIGTTGEEIKIGCKVCGATRYFVLNKGTRQEERVETADSWFEPIER